LAEKQARLSGDIKNTITQHPEEPETWREEDVDDDETYIQEHVSQTHETQEDSEERRVEQEMEEEEVEEEPLELVTRKQEPEDLSASPVKHEQPTAFRTLAAKKYFDEPLDISIQRKASEQDEADLVQKRAPLLDRYHPYP